MRQHGSEMGLSFIEVWEQVTNLLGRARTQARPFPSFAPSLATSSRGHWGALASRWSSPPSSLLHAVVRRQAWGSMAASARPGSPCTGRVSRPPAPRLLYLQDGHVTSALRPAQDRCEARLSHAGTGLLPGRPCPSTRTTRTCSCTPGPRPPGPCPSHPKHGTQWLTPTGLRPGAAPPSAGGILGRWTGPTWLVGRSSLRRGRGSGAAQPGSLPARPGCHLAWGRSRCTHSRGDAAGALTVGPGRGLPLLPATSSPLDPGLPWEEPSLFQKTGMISRRYSWLFAVRATQFCVSFPSFLGRKGSRAVGPGPVGLAALRCFNETQPASVCRRRGSASWTERLPAPTHCLAQHSYTFPFPPILPRSLADQPTPVSPRTSCHAPPGPPPLSSLPLPARGNMQLEYSPSFQKAPNPHLCTVGGSGAAPWGCLRHCSLAIFSGSSQLLAENQLFPDHLAPWGIQRARGSLAFGDLGSESSPPLARPVISGKCKPFLSFCSTSTNGWTATHCEGCVGPRVW